MQASNNLLKEFCQSIGMAPQGFNEKNQRSLSFDEKIIVTFLTDETDFITALSFIAPVGKPEDMRKLLEQNFLPEAHGGGRFALEPNSDRIILTRQWESVKTPVPQFSDDLEKFVNSAMQAQDFFNSGGAQAAQESAAPGQAPVDSLTAAYQSV